MIFNNLKDNEQFEASGYIKSCFLNTHELETLKKAYSAYISMDGGVIDFAKNLGYYISVFDSNIEKRKFINTILKELFTPKIEQLLNGYKILYGNFMYKEAGGKEIEVHQDFSFVDEKKYTAFNLWVPLQDTTVFNGGFQLIERSNKLFNSYRSATIPHNLTHYNEQFKKLMQPIDVAAGDGLLFDHRLFHYSGPNHANTTRVAVQMVVIPKAAVPVMYHYDPQKDKTKLSIYEITEDFLLTHNLWSNPTEYLNKIGETAYEEIPNAKDILKQIQPGNTSTFLQTIKKYFGYV